VRTKRARSVALAAGVAAGLALLVSACGGGGGGGSSTTTTVSSTAGKTFALLKVVNGTTDYLDPGLSYRLESWQLFQDVYLGLVVKAHVSCDKGTATLNCTTILPGLATTTGSVTNGGKTYEFTLRKGLKYSDGTPIKASDFPATIVRDFRLNSPGIGFFSNIAGVDACENNPTKCSSISGIVADDSAGTIKINLKAPQSDFLFILSIPFTSVVPASTPQKDTENPPPPASGPYYFSSYAPSKSIVMSRNPNWKKDEIPAVPEREPGQDHR
jgi:ABC-type dipeptide transport system, periplasmic component